MLSTRLGLTLLLVIVFIVNYAETSLEPNIQAIFSGPQTANRIATSIYDLEGNLGFRFHAATNRVAVIGFSLSYFFLFPLIALGTAWVLWRRPDVAPFQLLCFAITIDYLITLPFYLLFPIPERWAFPDSGAILLSDLWTTRLIELIRHISGLDNCFPSSHVSFTVVIILVCWHLKVRLWRSILMLGLTVVLATFVLGIHWIPDIIGGTAVGVLSVYLALKFQVRSQPLPAVATA